VDDRRLREESMVKAKKKDKAKADAKTKEKAKLTYAESIELKELPAEIDKLEKERDRLASELEQASSDAELLQRLGAEMQEVIIVLEEKEFRWLELSELAEE
jgi:ATP-binding cassette subfamily F protein uup